MKYKTREDAKKARELDEARKAGIAPPETDAETGQAINPHIPQYMTSAPWYLNQEKPSLKHQKDWRVTNKLADKWYARGAKGKANVKFKKGACEKCVQRLHLIIVYLHMAIPQILLAPWNVGLYSKELAHSACSYYRPDASSSYQRCGVPQGNERLQ
jgi:hypothetical protein